MNTVTGYYDGNSIVAIDKIDAHKNQMVSITLLDEDWHKNEHDTTTKRKAAIERFFGLNERYTDAVDPVEYQRNLRKEREIV